MMAEQHKAKVGIDGGRGEYWRRERRYCHVSNDSRVVMSWLANAETDHDSGKMRECFKQMRDRVRYKLSGPATLHKSGGVFYKLGFSNSLTAIIIILCEMKQK